MNKLDLILLIIIGVIATNKNFLTTYSFTKNKTIILFNFLFNYFRYFVFSNNIVKTRVVLADQVSDLISTMLVLMPNYLLQYCN